jgi:hypothetical protein
LGFAIVAQDGQDPIVLFLRVEMVVLVMDFVKITNVYAKKNGQDQLVMKDAVSAIAQVMENVVIAFAFVILDFLDPIVQHQHV